MVIPKINSAHGSDTRNIINQAIDSINTQGKSIQDLVAEGQLTPEQYVELIKVLNGLADKNEVRRSTDLQPIDVDEMNTRTKQLFTGGAVAIVGENAVGRENVKPKAISPLETDFLEPDVELNMFDGNFLRLRLSGAPTIPPYISGNSSHRAVKVQIEPNTTYSVIREPSSRFKIATDIIPNRNDGSLEGDVNISIIADSDIYHSTFTTGANDVVLYVDYTDTDQDVFIQVVKGIQSEFTVSEYTFKPNANLSVYSKKEIDHLPVTPDKATFLEKVNLYDGFFLRKRLAGSSDVQPYISNNATNRTARVLIEPNTTYSVIRQASSRFKIGTDTIPDRDTGTLDGAVNITIIGASDTHHATFTTGENDVVLYVNYSQDDEDIRLEVVKGVKTTQYGSDAYNPSPLLNVYSKEEVNAIAGSDVVKPLKLLMIGNSFSVDATEYLYDIAQSAGIYNFIIGNAYDSGQSLQGHWEKIQNSEGITAYNKWTPTEGYVSTPGALVSDIVTDENWDIVTFQQSSSNSVYYNTFQPHLDNLHDFVKSEITNPNVRFGLHMTWARSNPDFGGYETSEDMFNDIVTTYEQAMKDMRFDLLIPTGTAIENGRTNDYLESVGDRLTRDGAHLDRGIGRYVAALTIFELLFSGYYQKSIWDVTYYPERDGSDPFLGYLSKIAAKNAVLNPFKVTSI